MPKKSIVKYNRMFHHDSLFRGRVLFVLRLIREEFGSGIWTIASSNNKAFLSQVYYCCKRSDLLVIHVLNHLWSFLITENHEHFLYCRNKIYRGQIGPLAYQPINSILLSCNKKQQYKIIKNLFKDKEK